MNQESFNNTKRKYATYMPPEQKFIEANFTVDKTDHHETILDKVIFKLERDMRELNVVRKVLSDGRVKYDYLSMGQVPYVTHPRQASQMLFTKLESLLPKKVVSKDFIDAAIVLDDLLIEYNKVPRRGSLSISN